MAAGPPAPITAEGVEHQLLELVPDLLCICRDGRVVFINGAGVRLLGEEGTERILGRPLADYLHPDHGVALSGGLEPLTREPDGVPLMVHRADRDPIAVRVTARVLDDGLILVHARDLTERLPVLDSLLQAVARLEDRTRDLTRVSRQHALSARVFETASEGIMVLDRDLRITAVNPAFTEITGWTATDIVGRKPPVLTSGEIEPKQVLLAFETALSTGRWQGDMWNRRKDGERYAERLGIATIPPEETGAHLQYVVVFSDITQRKLDEERIRRQATYDALTGLPNRALFLDRLHQAVNLADRYGQMVGLMFIDLDGFKLVNDTLGHDMGDLLLQEAGRRLSACVRSGDTVARLGGDEFTVLMPELGNYQNAPVVARRILDALKVPFDLAGKEAFVSASIGITVFPDDARDGAAMMKNADAAMYRAKDQGKANFQFFTADMNAAVEERLVIKNGLAKALERDELLLHFQPKMEIATGRITGVEALLRWQAPDLGLVSPAKFIPVMEETGLIGRAGEWAIRAAARQHRAWKTEGLPLRIAVNLSVRQLRQPGFVASIEQMIAAGEIDPAGLEFEVTENMIIKDTETAIASLNRLVELGIRLAMDDFGTGYSSLSFLKRFPVESIKIDRSFIAEALGSSDDLAIIRTIISMGHSLRRRIVAEGVETPEQLEMLRALGCDEIQGYVLAPPLPAALAAEQVRKFLAQATNPTPLVG